MKQAFRFFDRNLVGYIRVRFNHPCLAIRLWYYVGLVRDYLLPFQVEDMRMIINNLGKFLSYRDVKVWAYYVRILWLLLYCMYLSVHTSQRLDILH